ncbi:hypothetical protein BH23CHL10_BH23CHL10_09810 [soil metagenome]
MALRSTASVPIVTREDALIESFAGDGVLVIFNAVGDQPDHALRAARTAIGLRKAVDALGADRSDAAPRFHIGINTGPAFVRSVGAAGRRTFSAIGNTTNLGAQLQGFAGAGEIVVGVETWAQLGDLAHGEPLPKLRVKGKAHPMGAWRLDGLDITRPRSSQSWPDSDESMR